MSNISSFIHEGAMAFLRREYKIIAIFVIVVSFILIALGFVPALVHIDGVGFKGAICFIVGTLCSGIASFIGMKAATLANAKVAQAARDKGMPKALRVAFNGGSILGISVVGFGLLGLSSLFLLFVIVLDDVAASIPVISGYSLGCSFIALFARVGGGIYTQAAGLSAISILEPGVIVGLLIGAMLPYFFTELTIQSVGKAANQMIDEVRRQFRENPGIMKGESKPDYARCVDISTQAALKEMILPDLMAVVAPIATGLLLGTKGLGGLLIGALLSAIMLAVFMANAGGAWDNAKKYIESGQHGGKGSEAHKAVVTGDIVGDPFKDTAGPAVDILIKLMSVISLLLAPILMNLAPLLSFLFS